MNTPTTLGERIKAARKSLFTQETLSLATGISQNAISNYEQNLRRPNALRLQKICDALGVSPEWLITGEGKMQREPQAEKNMLVLASIAPNSIDGDENGSEMINIPLVAARLSAGYGSLAVESDVEGYYAFSSAFLHRKGNPESMVVMKVEGDSMSPEIRHEDVVLIDQSKTTIKLGQIFAVGFEDAIYLKRIDKLPGKILLKSVNPAYPPVEIPTTGQEFDTFRVIGQVLWVGREY